MKTGVSNSTNASKATRLAWMLFATFFAVTGCQKDVAFQDDKINEQEKALITENNLGFQAAISDLILVPSGGKISLGSSVNVVSLAQLEDRSILDISDRVTFTSANPEIVEVDGTIPSRLAMKKLGSTKITATVSDLAREIEIEVIDPSAIRLDIIGKDTKGPAGTSLQFQAVTVLDNLRTIDVSEKAKWQVTPEDIATFDPTTKGHLNLLKPGKANITVTSSDGLVSQLEIEVISAVMIDISTDPERVNLPVGESETVKVWASYSNGQTLDVTKFSKFEIDGTDIAVMAGHSTINVIGKGNKDVKVSYLDKNKTLPVFGRNAEIVSLAIQPSTRSIPRGHSGNFTAIARYTDGTEIDVSSSATWTSEDPGILTATSSGKFTASSPGSGTLKAFYRGQSANANMTVTDKIVTQIKISTLTNVNTVIQGNTLQFKAVGTFSDGSTQDITNSVTWIAASTLIATFSNVDGSRGLLTAQSPGITQTRATIPAGDAIVVSDNFPIVVSEAVITALTISPSIASQPQGKKQSFIALATYSNGNSNVNVTNSVVWIADYSTSGHEDVLMVSNTGSDRGRAYGYKEGTGGLRAVVGNVSSNIATFTVTPKQIVTLRISPISYGLPLTLETASTQQFSATVTYTDNSTDDVTNNTDVQWHSSYNDVLTIHSGGVLGFGLAAKEGSSVLTALLTNPHGTFTSNPVSIDVVTPCSEQGKRSSYYCWYLSNVGESCDATCALRGGTHPATVGYFETSARCLNILAHLGRSFSHIPGAYNTDPPHLSCSILEVGLPTAQATLFDTGPGSASDPDYSRACACRG